MQTLSYHAVRLCEREKESLYNIILYTIHAGRDVEEIVKVLTEVEDWVGLSRWMGISSNNIITNCAGSLNVLKCHLRQLVEEYCDSQLTDDPCKVACDVALILERDMHPPKRRQARKLMSLIFSKLFNYSYY